MAPLVLLSALLASALCAQPGPKDLISSTCQVYGLGADARPAVAAALAAIGDAHQETAPEVDLLVWGLLQRTGTGAGDALAVRTVRQLNDRWSVAPLAETPRGRIVDAIAPWATSEHYGALLGIVSDWGDDSAALWGAMGHVVAEAMASGRTHVFRILSDAETRVRLPGAVLAEKQTGDGGLSIYTAGVISAPERQLRAAITLPWLSDAQREKLGEYIGTEDGASLPSPLAPLEGAKCAESALRIIAQAGPPDDEATAVIDALLGLENALDGTPMAVRAAEIAGANRNVAMVNHILKTTKESLAGSTTATQRTAATRRTDIVAHAVAASVSAGSWEVALRLLSASEAAAVSLDTRVALHLEHAGFPGSIRSAHVALGSLLAHDIMTRITANSGDRNLQLKKVSDLQQFLAGKKSAAKNDVKSAGVRTLLAAAAMFSAELVETAKVLSANLGNALGGTDKILHAIAEMALAEPELLSPDKYLLLNDRILSTRPGLSQAVDEAREIAIRLVRRKAAPTAVADKPFAAAKKISKVTKAVEPDDSSSDDETEWSRRSKRIPNRGGRRRLPSLSSSDDDADKDDFRLSQVLQKGVARSKVWQIADPLDYFAESFDSTHPIVKNIRQERMEESRKKPFKPKVAQAFGSSQSAFTKVASVVNGQRQRSSRVLSGSGRRERT